MLDGAVDGAGAGAPVDGLLAQDAADQGDGAPVVEVRYGGAGQPDLAHQLALQPCLPLLVRHLGEGGEGDVATGHHQGIEAAYALKQGGDGGAVGHVDQGVSLAMADPDHLMILGEQFADGGSDGARGTHYDDFHLGHSCLGYLSF
ncbi:hypothetical protein D3C79_816750 [compost metagenome]